MNSPGPTGTGPGHPGTIGPYVVLREWPPGVQGVRFFRASDHLTGLPALLQTLPRPLLEAAAPDFDPADLPASPALLPLSDYLAPEISGLAEAVLVSELPLGAAPARNIRLAARGALGGLQALHEHGRAHGQLHLAQLWEAEGTVRLAGGGLYPLGGEWTVARDLRDLGSVLGSLGEWPPALEVLRDPPPGLSAREVLARLDATPEAAPSIRLPLEPPAPVPAPEAVEPAPAEPETALPENQPPAAARPVPVASRAAERLKADAQRQRRLAELRARATSAGEPGAVEAAEAEAATASTASETPQQRRQREHAARLAEEKQSEQWRAGHPPKVQARAAGGSGAPELAAEKRQIKPVRFGWDSNEGKWHAVHDGKKPPATSRPAWPVWLWPLLALLGVLLLVGLWQASSKSATATCCDVRFAVLGQGKTAQLSVQNAPARAGWQAGRKLGSIPGVVHFPVAGHYRLNVSAPGFSPAALDVTVPAPRPLSVRLGP